MLCDPCAMSYIRFVDLIPSKWIFFLASLLIRIIQGVGAALFYTASFAMIPILYPDRLGTVFVRIASVQNEVSDQRGI